MKTLKRPVDRRQSDIKKKLTAAIAMLLVSCVMVVTSTYAWFTLSTAPEITGIQTTIGANGNLEIALANGTTWATPDSIISQEGDGLKSLVEKNITWGNLVDLGATAADGSNVYGLDKIVLYPSKLNVSNNKVDHNSILKTPEYGTDGRVTQLKNNVLTGLYDADNLKFVSSTTGYGVRALGTVSGMSDREFAYNSALSQINSNKNLAANEVRTSWVNYGDTLAAIAVKYAGNKEGTTITKEEYDNLVELVGDLEDVMEYIDKALIYALDGYLASAQSPLTAGEGEDLDTIFLAVERVLLTKSLMTTANDGDVTLSGTSFTIAGVEQSISNEQFVNLVTEFNAMVDDVKTAKRKIADVASKFTDANSTVGWSDISEAFSCLIDQNYVSVNNIKISEITPGKILSILKDTTVQLGAGDNGESSGIYYDIASFVDNYQSSVSVPVGTKIVYGDFTLDVEEPIDVVITTKYTGTSKLEAVSRAVSAAGKPTSGSNTSGSAALTDTYGYVIDYFLRTNATNSNLLLSEAANRVSTDAEGLMGSGSNMSFTAIDPDFSANNIVKLMEAIRVVFVDADYNILAEARLDKSTLSGSSTYKMNLKIWDASANEGRGGFAANQTIITNMDVNTPVKLSTIV